MIMRRGSRPPGTLHGRRPGQPACPTLHNPGLGIITKFDRLESDEYLHALRDHRSAPSVSTRSRSRKPVEGTPNLDARWPDDNAERRSRRLAHRRHPRHGHAGGRLCHWRFPRLFSKPARPELKRRCFEIAPGRELLGALSARLPLPNALRPLRFRRRHAKSLRPTPPSEKNGARAGDTRPRRARAQSQDLEAKTATPRRCANCTAVCRLTCLSNVLSPHA